MADITPAPFRHTLRILCAALLSSQVVLLLAVSATLGSDGFDAPPLWAVGVVVLAGAAEATMIGLLGYRLPALTPGLAAPEAARVVTGAVQGSTILRFALAEAVTLLAIALAFVVDQGGAILGLVGVAISITLGVLHVWPSDRVLTRMRDALEREGSPSRLDEVMDSPPQRG